MEFNKWCREAKLILTQVRQDVNCEQRGTYPLHAAVKARNLKFVKALLDMGADPRRSQSYWFESMGKSMDTMLLAQKKAADAPNDKQRKEWEQIGDLLKDHSRLLDEHDATLGQHDLDYLD